jgi:hypothetical protein
MAGAVPGGVDNMEGNVADRNTLTICQFVIRRGRVLHAWDPKLRTLQQRRNRFKFYSGVLDFNGCCKNLVILYCFGLFRDPK